MARYTNVKLSTEENYHNIREMIGDNLKSLRKSHGDRQQDVGELIGCKQSHISSVEHGKGDLKASDVAILADRYNVYVENFYNESGTIPFDLITRLLRKVSLNTDSSDVKGYLDSLIEGIIKGDKCEDFLRLFFVSLSTCYNYKNPMDHISREVELAKEKDVLKHLEQRAKMWGLEQ